MLRPEWDRLWERMRTIEQRVQSPLDLIFCKRYTVPLPASCVAIKRAIEVGECVAAKQWYACTWNEKSRNRRFFAPRLPISRCLDGALASIFLGIAFFPRWMATRRGGKSPCANHTSEKIFRLRDLQVEGYKKIFANLFLYFFIIRSFTNHSWVNCCE